jgi:hypothetical protein
MQGHWGNTPQGGPRLPVRIKVQIATLGLEMEIELKENRGSYELLALQSPGDFVNPSGNAWHATITDIAAVHEVAQLLKQCALFPEKPERITILDGTSVHFDAVVDGENIRLKIKDFPPMEAQLIERLLKLCSVALPDPAFKAALKFLGQFWEHDA